MFSKLKSKLSKILDKQSMEGTIRISKVFLDGTEEIVHQEIFNKIVNPAKRNLLTALHSSVPSEPISSFQAGTGGTIDPEGKYPKNVDPETTALTTSVITIPITSYTEDLTNITVTFIIDIPADQANGNLISEAGMFTSVGDLFNVKYFPGIPKTSDFAIHFEWTVRYV